MPTEWIGAHYEVRDIRYAQARAMRSTRGPAELLDPCARLHRIQTAAWHRAAANALEAVYTAAENANGPKMLWLIRRAQHLCPGPTRRLFVGGVCID